MTLERNRQKVNQAFFLDFHYSWLYWAWKASSLWYFGHSVFQPGQTQSEEVYKNKGEEANQSSFSKLWKRWGFDFNPIKGQDSGQILFYIKWLPSLWNNLVVRIAVVLVLASLWGEMLKLIFSVKRGLNDWPQLPKQGLPGKRMTIC